MQVYCCDVFEHLFLCFVFKQDSLTLFLAVNETLVSQNNGTQFMFIRTFRFKGGSGGNSRVFRNLKTHPKTMGFSPPNF